MFDADATAAFRRELRGYFRNRVRDTHLAEDLTQDVLAKALAAMKAGSPPRDLRAWLYRIARHTLVDAYRRLEHRRGEYDRTNVVDRVGHAIAQADADGAGSHRDAKEIAACLGVLLNTLPDSQRQALIASDVEGRPHRESATRLGVSLTAIKSRVLRARQALRRALVDCCRIEFDGRGMPVDYRRRQSGACRADAGSTGCRANEC